MRDDESDLPEPTDRPVSVNPLKPHGQALLLFAGGAAVISLLGFVHGSVNLFAILVGLVCAGVAGVRGLMLFLQPFAWPAGAPAGICGVRKNVASLVRDLLQDDSHLGTYDLPTGFWELIARSIAPQFTYTTPATRNLTRIVSRGMVTAVVCLVIGVLLAAAGAVVAGIILAAGAVAVAGVRVFILYSTVPDAPPGRPTVVRLAGDQLRLTDAGNPIGLLQNTVRLTSPFRDDDDTRMSYDGPSKLNKLNYESFQADLSFESRPVPVPSNPEQTKAAQLLEYTAGAAGLLGLAILVLVKPTPENAAVKLAGLAIPFLCVSMSYAAFALRNTFRFQSDLIAIWFEGNYQYQGSGLNGPRSAEVELVKSDINTVILGTRLLSECTVGGHWKRRSNSKSANVQAMQATWSALNSPRYVVRTVVDADFRVRLDKMADAITGYREVFRDVVGLNLDSPEAQRIQWENVLEQQQQETFRHQLMLRAQMQNQIVAKAMEGLTPEQAMQMLAQGGDLQTPAQPTVSAPRMAKVAQIISPPTLPAEPQPLAGGIPPAVEKSLVDAMKVYYKPHQPEDVKALAKQMIDQLKKTHKLRSAQMAEIAKRVRAEFGLRVYPERWP